MESVYKEMESNSMANEMLVLRWHNPNANLIPSNITIVYYVVIRTHARREYKLQS